MTYAELLPLFDGANPVELPGMLGLLIRLREESPECGVQIPGEPEITWIEAKNMQHIGGGVFRGKPSSFDDPFKVRRPAQKGSGIFASKNPKKIGEVLVAGNYRYIVTKEISRSEFDAQLAENTKKGYGGVAGSAELDGASARDFQVTTKPPKNVKYFYRCKVEFSKQIPGEELEPWQ